MNISRIEGLLGSLEAILSMQGGANESMVEPFLVDFYEEMVGKYRPVLKAVPMLSSKIAEDAAPLLTAVLKTVNDLVENPDLLVETARMRTSRATTRLKNLNAYTEAGFSREEAMSLLLADVANAKEFRQNVLKKGGSSSSSSKKS